MSETGQTAYFNLVTRISVKQDSETKPALSAFQSSLANLTDASYIAGKAISTALGFATYQLVSSTLMGIKSFVSDSIEEFVDFEYAMAGVARTVQDFAENEVALTEFADTMSRELGVSAVEVAEAMQFMGSVGMSSSQIMADFNDIAKMGVALQVDLEQAIQTVVKAQQVWNDEGYTAIQISDILNEMTNRTALNMDFLEGSLRMGGAAAAATGTNLEQMTAILVELAETGFQGTMAGRSLNTILIQMGLKAEETMKYLRDLKEQGFDVNLEAMNGFEDALPIHQIEMLGQATENLTDRQKIQLAQNIAGTNFLKQMLILLDNWRDLEENVAIATDANNSTQKEFNTVMDTSQKKLDQQRAIIQSLQRDIGEGLTPAWLGLQVAVYGAVDTIVNGIEDIDTSAGAVAEYTATIDELNMQLQQGDITYEQFRQAQEDARQAAVLATVATVENADSLVYLKEKLEGYTDAGDRSRDMSEALKQSLTDLKAKHWDLVLTAMEAESIMNDLSSAYEYAISGTKTLSYESEDLGTGIAFLDDEFNTLTFALYEVNQEILQTETQLKNLKAEMYDNSLASAELRLEQMRLDDAFKDGRISEEEYEAQTALLESQMRDLRIEGQELSIQNMKLNNTYENQKEEAALLEDQTEAMRTAAQRLADAMDSMPGILQQVIDMFAELRVGTTSLKSAISGLESQTGISLGAMIEDWENYRETVLEAMSPENWAELAQILTQSGMTLEEWLASGGVVPGGSSTTPTEPPTGGEEPTTPDYQYRKTGYYYHNGVMTSDETNWYGSKDLAQTAWDKIIAEQKDAGTSSTSSFERRVAAALGFQGWVNKPTLFIAGEGSRPEYVDITPQGGDMMGGSRLGNVTVNLPNVTSVEDPEQVRRIFRQIMLQLSGER